MDGVLNLGSLGLVVLLVAAVLAIAWLYQRHAKARRKKPGQYLRYQASVYNSATCRGLLGKPAPQDTFTYELENAPAGGWYIHFTRHNPTNQQLDTWFQLQFEDDAPAVFSLTFVREAFGMREPVMGESLLDEFFSQKLAAKRLA